MNDCSELTNMRLRKFSISAWCSTVILFCGTRLIVSCNLQWSIQKLSTMHEFTSKTAELQQLRNSLQDNFVFYFLLLYARLLTDILCAAGELEIKPINFMYSSSVVLSSDLQSDHN